MRCSIWHYANKITSKIIIFQAQSKDEILKRLAEVLSHGQRQKRGKCARDRDRSPTLEAKRTRLIGIKKARSQSGLAQLAIAVYATNYAATGPE